MTITKEITEGRNALHSLIEEIAVKYRPEKQKLLAEKSEGWLKAYDNFDYKLVDEVIRLTSTGVLSKFKLFEDEKLKPLPAENGVEGIYRKEIIIRGDDYVFTLFNFGSKKDINPENPRIGSTTPYHGHSLRCAATAFVPNGLKEADCTSPFEVTFEGDKPVNSRRMPFAIASVRLPETGLQQFIDSHDNNPVDHDNHAVFNGHPDKPAYTGHFYLTKGIGLDENGKPTYIDISNELNPKTAIGIKTVYGYPDAAEPHKIKETGREYALVPLSIIKQAQDALHLKNCCITPTIRM